MENTENRITRLEVEMENVDEWLKDHKRFHEKSIERQDRKQWGLWMLLIATSISSVAAFIKGLL